MSRRRNCARRCATTSTIRNTSRRRRNTGPSRARVVTPFYGFDHVTLVRNHGDEPGGDYERWLDARDPKAGDAARAEERLPHDYRVPQAYRTAIPEELYATSFLGERAEAYLDEAEDEPFFLMVSFPDPHHPFNPPGKYWDMYKPEQFPVPEAFTRNDWTPPTLVQNIFKERESGKANLTGMGTIGVSAREAQEARALTCGMIACIDDAVGAVLEALDPAAERDDTVVIFTSDHGDHLGDHRLMLKGAEQYQSIVRVPFIWSDPDAQARPRAPTRSPRRWISVRPSSTAPGSSRAAACRQKASCRCSTASRYATACSSNTTTRRPSPGSDNVPARVHTLIDGRYRVSVFHGTGWGELYDLENDPGEFEICGTIRRMPKTRAAMTEHLVLAEIEHVDRVPLPTRRA